HRATPVKFSKNRKKPNNTLPTPKFPKTSLRAALTTSRTKQAVTNTIKSKVTARVVRKLEPFVRHTKLIIMLSAYSRNCLTRNSTSFKPC
ncbi:hypothetical protein SFRURICE_008106, partial [Spodoptera frugiperda]